MRSLDSTFHGRAVIAADGQVLGVVGGLSIETDSWSVRGLQVRLKPEVRDRLGIARSMFHVGTVELPISLVQSVGDMVVLSVGVGDLRQALPADAEAPSP